MAKAAWCTVTPTSGKENGTINISAAAHTGRIARSTSVTVTAANGTKPSVIIAVSQAAKSVSTTMDSTKPDIPKTGAVVEVNGTSNSSKLSWELFGRINGGEETPAELPINAKVNGISITNGVVISGDPGASGLYNFVVTLNCHPSIYPFDLELILKVADDTGTKKTCTMILKAGNSRLEANKASVSLVSAGTAQAVNLTSNDDWTVS